MLAVSIVLYLNDISSNWRSEESLSSNGVSDVEVLCRSIPGRQSEIELAVRMLLSSSELAVRNKQLLVKVQSSSSKIQREGYKKSRSQDRIYLSPRAYQHIGITSINRSTSLGIPYEITSRTFVPVLRTLLMSPRILVTFCGDKQRLFGHERTKRRWTRGWPGAPSVFGDSGLRVIARKG